MSEKKLVETPNKDTGEIPDVYFLESTDQLKVLSDPLRYRMTLLLNTPQTGAGLARALGLSRAKAHYHLKLLQSAGLVDLHSEAIKDGIVEKYYTVRGRMLDFRRLLPSNRADYLPENVEPETVSAVSGFLSAMLQVSGEKTAKVRGAEALKDAHHFDFESTLSRPQYEELKAKLERIRSEVIALSKDEPDSADMVRFHLTNYLVPLSEGDKD